MLKHLNDTLFLALNASSPASPSVVILARFLAEGSVPLAVVIVIGLWIWSDDRQRAPVLTACIGVLFGLGIDQAIGLVWFEPRPFVTGIGRTLLAHVPDSSFPSDHATVLWTLGWTLVGTTALRRWGWLFVVVGFPVAWARIYLSLHFPLDMAGSMGVSLATAILARRALPTVERWILPPIDTLYEWLCRRMGMPRLRRDPRQG